MVRPPGVSDRGLVHRRNEDAFFLEVIGAAAVAVVCDGVSTSAAPDIAAQVAADTVGRSLSDALRETLARPGSPGPGWDPGERGDRRYHRRRGGRGWCALDGAGDRDAPSCTAVAECGTGATSTVGSPGDSRAYWIDVERRDASPPTTPGCGTRSTRA